MKHEAMKSKLQRVAVLRLRIEFAPLLLQERNLPGAKGVSHEYRQAAMRLWVIGRRLSPHPGPLPDRNDSIQPRINTDVHR